jgi:hypothetical protein
MRLASKDASAAMLFALLYSLHITQLLLAKTTVPCSFKINTHSEKLQECFIYEKHYSTLESRSETGKRRNKRRQDKVPQYF